MASWGTGQGKEVFTDFWISIFGFSDFQFQISSFSLIEIFLINQEVGNKKWLKTEGIFCTQCLNLFAWYYRRYQAVRFGAYMKITRVERRGWKEKIWNSELLWRLWGHKEEDLLNSKFRRGFKIFNCFKCHIVVVCQNLVCLVCLVWLCVIWNVLYMFIMWYVCCKVVFLHAVICVFSERSC